MKTVTLLKTGLANLASVQAAFDRLGARTELAETADDVSRAERLVVPGVGAFEAAMSVLKEADLASALRDRVDKGRPTLGICLGLQLLGLASEESPGVTGLGCVPEEVRGFSPEVISPQMGWNRVVPATDSKLLEAGYAYFANSYRFETIPERWTGATSEYGGTLVAALERGAVLGCQFHPELSGAYGERLMSRWLSLEVTPC